MRVVITVCLVSLLLSACGEVCRDPPIGTFGYTHEMYLRDKAEYEKCVKRHGGEVPSSKWLEASASDHSHTWIVTDTVLNFQPGVTTEADVETVVGAPLSKRYDAVTGERFFTYGHSNATFRFAKNDKLIEFYGPTQTPTPSPVPKQ